MADYLSVSFEDDLDGTGRLSVTADSAGFSGSSSAYFDAQRLIEFAEALGTYPLPDLPIKIAGGFWSTDARRLEQEHVAVEVGKVGSRGHVGVQVHLMTARWPDTRPESVGEVRLELLTNYSALDNFRRELVLVLSGGLGAARLQGDQPWPGQMA